MPHLLLWLFFLAYFTFFNKCEAKPPQEDNEISYILSKLLQNNKKPPLLLYIDPNQNDYPENSKFKSFEDSSESVKESSIEESSDELAKFFSSIGQRLEGSRQKPRSFEDSSENFGQLFRSIGQPSGGIKQRIRSIDESGDDLGQLLRSIGQGFTFSRDEDENEEENDEGFKRTKAIVNDERAYLLHHLLRTIEQENIDPELIQKLRPAKDLLRSAFIGRCKKLNQCRRQCPKKKKSMKFTCTVQCKQIYDDLDECEEPQQNNCNSCGRTQPPSWLL